MTVSLQCNSAAMVDGLSDEERLIVGGAMVAPMVIHESMRVW